MRDTCSEINSRGFFCFISPGSSSCTSSTKTRRSTLARWVPTFYSRYSDRILASASMAMPGAVCAVDPLCSSPPCPRPGLPGVVCVEDVPGAKLGLLPCWGLLQEAVWGPALLVTATTTRSLYQPLPQQEDSAAVRERSDPDSYATTSSYAEGCVVIHSYPLLHIYQYLL
jgi:hypothetical protein